MLQTVERARAPARRLGGALELAEQHAQNRIAAKLIVVVEVLVAQRQAEDPLRDQSLERRPVKSGLRRSPKQAENRPVNPIALSVSFSNSAPGISGRNHPAIEIRHNPPPAGPSKHQLFSAYTASASGRS